MKFVFKHFILFVFGPGNSSFFMLSLFAFIGCYFSSMFSMVLEFGILLLLFFRFFFYLVAVQCSNIWFLLNFISTPFGRNTTTSTHTYIDIQFTAKNELFLNFPYNHSNTITLVLHMPRSCGGIHGCCHRISSIRSSFSYYFCCFCRRYLL